MKQTFLSEHSVASCLILTPALPKPGSSLRRTEWKGFFSSEAQRNTRSQPGAKVLTREPAATRKVYCIRGRKSQHVMAHFFCSRFFSLVTIRGIYLVIISLEYYTNPNSNVCFAKVFVSTRGFQLLFLLLTLDQWQAASMCERSHPAMHYPACVAVIHLRFPSTLASG